MAKQIVVIGGGASGLMAAGQASVRGAEVLLLEKKSRLGSKIRISGKGRCNLTNAGEIANFIENFPGNGKFLYASFKEFDNEALRKFFWQYGVKTKTERGGRVFPISDDSETIIAALAKFVEESGVKVHLNNQVEDIYVQDGKVIGVKICSQDRTIPAEAVVISTGGASYPGTGSTGDGYKFAEKLGHNVVPVLPSLVPLRTLETWPKELQGLALKNVTASLWLDGKKTEELFGEMLFTHFGISGPIILTLSRAAARALRQKQKVQIKINLKPALTYEQVDSRIQRDFEKNSNKQFKNSLYDLLPKSIIPIIIKLSEIEPDKTVNQISREERKRLIKLLREMTLTITNTLGLETAIVTSGGVDVKQINPATMESKIVKGLFWAGEVMDIDGVTGGYNLQAAFSTGFKAGKAAADYVLN